MVKLIAIAACDCSHPSQVALERVKEYSELAREPPEFVEPRPPTSWPSKGAIHCQDLVIRYAVRLCLIWRIVDLLTIAISRSYPMCCTI